jgi:hypothetical protein
MYADAVYYSSPDPDRVAAAPAGMTLGTALGQYSDEVTIPMYAVREELGEPGFIRAVEAHLRGPA